MPGQLFVFYRPQNSAQARPCDVSYQENWQDDAFVDQSVGTVTCPGLPELQLVRHQNANSSNYFTINDGATPVSVKNLNPGVPKFVGISQIAGIVAANPFPTLGAMDEFFEKLRGEEPGTINPHGNLVSWTTQDGLWLGVDISWRRLLGHETSPLKDGVRGGEQGNLRDDLTLDGFALAIRPLPLWRTGRNTLKTVFGNIFAVLDPAIYVASAWGTPPRHAHSATADTHGSLNFIQAGLRLCFKPDAQLVHVIREHARDGGNPDVLLSWNIALGICGVFGEDRLHGENVTFLDGSQPDTLDVTSPQAAGQVVAEISALLGKDISLGVRALYHLPDVTDGNRKFRWDHHGLEVGVMLDLIGLFSHHDEWLPTIDSHVDIPAPQRPTEIAAPEPEPPREPDQPPPLPEEPEFEKGELSQLVGWEERRVFHFPSGKGTLTADEQRQFNAFVQAVHNQAQKNKGILGWKYELEARGHASTLGPFALNARYSVARAFRGVQEYMARALALHQANSGSELAFTPGLVTTISRGEREPLERDTKRAIPRDSCKPLEYSGKGCNAKQDKCAVLKCTLPGTREETELIEDRTTSRRVEITLRAHPPGTFVFAATAAIDPEQFNVDTKMGPDVATYLKTKGRFRDADYDDKSNVLLVVVNDAELQNPRRLSALKSALQGAATHFVTKAKAFSGRIEIVYQPTTEIANWDQIIDEKIANARDVKFPGGVVAVLDTTRKSLKDIRQQRRAEATRIADQARGIVAGHKIVDGDIRMLEMSLPPSGPFSREQLATINQVVLQAQKQFSLVSLNHVAHLVVNDPTFETGPIQHAINSANLKVESVARGAVKDANTALGRKLYILIAPKGTDIDLSDKDHLTTIAIRNAMKGN